MAKMRATLRKVAQVTPPPSPKNGEDIKGHSEWSTRLRNHSAASAKVSNGRRAKIARIKKESPVFHNEDSNCSRSNTSSPVCDASRVRMRQPSGEALNYWPRRSARLIGIPAELEEQQNKSNGSINAEDGTDEDGENEEEEESAAVANGVAGETESDQCKDCKQRKTKQVRTLEALLIESQRFMHYPSKGSGCRMGRSTYNSRDIRPPQTSPQTSPQNSPSTQTSPQIEPVAPTPPLPASVDQVQFSFEIVPTGTSWYQTFLRDETQEPLPDDPPTAPAPFLLPYEMSLEAILKSNRTARKTNKAATKAKGTKKAVPLSFRPIISTRLQMQSAARQSQLAAAAAAASAASAKDNSKSSGGSSGGSSCSNNRHDRRKRQKPWFNMPRKSPRCHASTMAILCSKSDSDSEAVHAKTMLPAVEEEPAESPIPEEPAAPVKEVQQPDSYLVQVLEELLTQGLERRPVSPAKKRGRPRKRTTAVQNPQLHSELVESSLTEMLATPMERIEDIVDERILPNQEDICMFNDDDDLPIAYPTDPWTTKGSDRTLPEASEVFHDLDSHSGSRSSSVYETASEIGSTSTSTGTCDSRRKAWRGGGSRRKRRNMTGWPRSKRRRPLQLNIIDDDEDLNLTGDLSCNGDEDEEDDGPPVLSPIREESTMVVDGSDPRPQTQPRSSYVTKPFQFQRKTLRFVGKRILRPAAQRHAPQRLEYWPCFPTESSSTGGKRRKRKTS